MSTIEKLSSIFNTGLRLILTIACTIALSGISTAEAATPVFLGSDLTSNRFDGLPNETLQVVTFYDGHTSSTPTLSIEVRDRETGVLEPIVIDNIRSFVERIDTFEYDLNGSEITYEFNVSGVVGNGVVDGLAFGLLWKDHLGNYHIFRSNAVGIGGAHFVGAWPLGLSDSKVVSLTPQLTSSFGREQVRATLYGAALMRNGSYSCGTCGDCIFADGFETGDMSMWVQ